MADRLLNHVAGTISGVAAVYQRQQFLAERKAALEAWAAHVVGLGQQPDDLVAPAAAADAVAERVVELMGKTGSREGF